MHHRRAFSGVQWLLPAAVFLVSPALASDPASHPFSNDEVPTVLTATRLQQSLFDVPAAVTVIDRQMIEQSGMRELPELLRLVPGMVVGYDSGSEAFVSFHGTSADLARRMQVLVDGRSIYQPLQASVDWIGLPLELADVERIEVIRGPNSASWGANSFFAVVNIITRHPADVDRARISYTNGEDGVEDFLARLAHRTAALDWRLTVAGRSDDGFETNPRQGNSTFTDSKDVESIYGRGVWTLSPRTTLDVSFGGAQMSAEMEYRNSFIVRVPVAERENSYLSLALDQELNEANRLNVQVSHSRFSHEEPWYVRLPRVYLHPALDRMWRIDRDYTWQVLGGGNPSGTPELEQAKNEFWADIADPDSPWYDDGDFRSDQIAHERRTEVGVHDTWVVTPDFRTVFGFTFDHAEVDSPTYLDGRGENTVWRLFAHGEWRFTEDWLLNLGGNQEFDEGAGNFFSPRAALNWQMTESQGLRLVYSRAVRTPDIRENQADWTYGAVALTPADAPYAGRFFQSGQGNGQAETERISSREIGYFARLTPARMTMDLRVFEDHLRLTEHSLEIYAESPISDGFLIRPAYAMSQHGAELGMDWRPLPSQRLQLNYAYMDMDDALHEDDNTNFVPQHSGSLAWWQDYGNGWQFGNTYAFYNDLRVDKFFFDRLETRLAKKVRLPRSQQLTLAAVMQTRLTDDPELREDNGGDRHRGWVSADWRY
jgi:iron complex outermembrane receptor protein